MNLRRKSTLAAVAVGSAVMMAIAPTASAGPDTDQTGDPRHAVYVCQDWDPAPPNIQPGTRVIVRELGERYSYVHLVPTMQAAIVHTHCLDHFGSW